VAATITPTMTPPKTVISSGLRASAGYLERPEPAVFIGHPGTGKTDVLRHPFQARASSVFHQLAAAPAGNLPRTAGRCCRPNGSP
jgi:hypothetical protein